MKQSSVYIIFHFICSLSGQTLIFNHHIIKYWNIRVHKNKNYDINFVSELSEHGTRARLLVFCIENERLIEHIDSKLTPLINTKGLFCLNIENWAIVNSAHQNSECHLWHPIILSWPWRYFKLSANHTGNAFFDNVCYIYKFDWMI